MLPAMLRCETRRGDRLCGEPVSYVFRNAFATRLICDGCASEYLSAEKTLGAVLELAKPLDGPTTEGPLALFELIPPRRAVLKQLAQAKEAVRKFERVAQLRERETRMVWRWGTGLTVLALGICAGMEWVPKALVLWPIGLGGALLGLALATLRGWVWRLWTRPRLEDIDKEFGRPEESFLDGEGGAP